MIPVPSPEEVRHSQALVRLIREHIERAGGWLSFDAFMDLALYAPRLGYYRAGGAKIGAKGDFTTAPEVSDLFSRCVAVQCAEVLQRIRGSILEFGAGTGRMAALILQSLERLDVLPERYLILEISGELREQQQDTIQRLVPHLASRIVWLDTLPDVQWYGVVLANEVLDALPCERFVVRGESVAALGVTLTPHGGFGECERTADVHLASACAELIHSLPAPLPDGYRSESCLRLGAWIASVAERLAGGVILLCDYGLPRAHYYHPDRNGGTLRCHYRHLVHDDPFVNIGIQDITAWVDFTRVAEAAGAAGLTVCGFSTQAAFLLGAGIEALLAQPADNVTHARRASEARQLLLPGEMGEAFKVMALSRDFSDPLRGFGLQDLRFSL